MVRRFGRPICLLLFAALGALAVPIPAVAQGSSIKGVVFDAKGQPVEGAVVTIMSPSTSRRFDVKSNRKGEFIQIGLPTGAYTVTAEKDKVASAPVSASARAGGPVTISLILGVPSAASNKEAEAKTAELVKLFEAGVAASSAGRHDEAIEQFNQALAINDACYDCYNNVGYSYSQKKEYDKAEAAYKKSVELNPNQAGGWSGLANVYNAQRKFDLAAEASAKATELSANLSAAGGSAGNADALYNQGVIFWNGGKIAEAKKSFEGAIQANPSHAEAHYQLGMALVNEGNLAGAATMFETYLTLAPDGPNAATAKSLVAQLKK